MSRPSDASVHRCEECGTWCLGSKPCTTCAVNEKRPTLDLAWKAGTA